MISIVGGGWEDNLAIGIMVLLGVKENGAMVKEVADARTASVDDTMVAGDD